MTSSTMSKLKPGTAVLMALALITTTFAGISTADHEDPGFEYDWDNETGILTISPTPFLNSTTFSYDVDIGSSIDGTQHFYTEDADVPTGEVSVTTNLTDGYYWVEIAVWNSDENWYDGGPICMGMNCSTAQVEATYDESTMVATLHISGANQNESISAWLHNDWTNEEEELTNVSDGYSIDMSTYGDGFYCLGIEATTSDGFDITYDEVCFQIGEEPVWPSMDAYYDDSTMTMYVELYDLTENSSFTYEFTLESYETGFAVGETGDIDSNVTTLEFDIDLRLATENQSYGIYWAYYELWDTTNGHTLETMIHLFSGGIEFCYGDQTDCEYEDIFVCDNGNEIPMDWVNDGMDDCGDNSDEDSDECPFENVNGSPCEPVATNPCYADHESDECYDYALDYCENVNPGDPGCDDMGGEEQPTPEDFLEWFDADGDGALTLDEIINGINEGNLLSGEPELSEDEENHIGIMFNEADENGDGALDLDELAYFIYMLDSDDGGEGDCPFEDVAGSPCEPVETNPCAADHESDECYDYMVDYCVNVNPDDPGCNTEHTFICGNGDEIPFDWVNDGEEDCPDGADEQQYDAAGDEINWFDCHDGSEIWIHQVNDGTDDCAYGEDESHGTDEGGADMEFDSMDVDIWFEQWDDSSMEFVMVQRMVINDAEIIAEYAMMADMYMGNSDGEVSQDEVDLLILMMSSDILDEADMADIMELDGAHGMLVDAWLDVEGLVEGDSEIVLTMGQVVLFSATPYADSTTHSFVIHEDDDTSDDSGMEPVEDCEIDSIWIHNSDTWSVSSITDSAGVLSFEYEEYNNAWFSGDCPDDSGTVTFTLEKADGGELPDDTVEDDWEDMDMNKFPICAYAYAAMMANGTMDARAGIDTAPESGDYTIDLADGAEYMIYVVCMDPEGDDMTVTVSNADLNLTSTYTATAEAEASLLLSVPVGYDGTYVFDVTWTDGHHTESGTLTVNGMGDGTGGDLEADGDGFLPGFTAALGLVALLGAAMISSRRN